MNERPFQIALWRVAAISLLASLAAPGCFTYSSYQSARIVERGEPQVTFALSRSNIVEADNDDDAAWYAFETCLRFGIAKRIDGSFMFSIFQGVQEGWGAGVVTLDVRAGIIKNYLAFVLPTALTLGDSYLASLRMQPGAVATIPLGKRLEITGAVRAHTFVRVPELFAMGYNVGLGIGSASGTWTLRPEVGWMVFRKDEEDGATYGGPTYAQYGLGIEFNGRKPRAEKEKGS